MVVQEVVIVDASTVGKTKKKVADRTRKGKCLCCENSASRRGLCNHCYHAWRITRMAIASTAKKAAYDARLIRLGKLLPAQAVRALKHPSVFSDAAQTV